MREVSCSASGPHVRFDAMSYQYIYLLQLHAILLCLTQGQSTRWSSCIDRLDQVRGNGILPFTNQISIHPLIHKSLCRLQVDRCHRMKRECLLSIPKPRKRRAQSALGDGSPNGTQAIPLSQLLDHPTPPTHNCTVRWDEPKDNVKVRQDVSHNHCESFSSLLASALKLDAVRPPTLSITDTVHQY